jgi:hypothetical protein
LVRVQHSRAQIHAPFRKTRGQTDITVVHRHSGVLQSDHAEMWSKTGLGNEMSRTHCTAPHELEMRPHSNDTQRASCDKLNRNRAEGLLVSATRHNATQRNEAEHRTVFEVGRELERHWSSVIIKDFEHGMRMRLRQRIWCPSLVCTPSSCPICHHDGLVGEFVRVFELCRGESRRSRHVLTVGPGRRVCRRSEHPRCVQHVRVQRS